MSENNKNTSDSKQQNNSLVVNKTQQDFFDPVDNDINKNPKEYKKQEKLSNKEKKEQKKTEKKAKGPWYKRLGFGLKKWFFGVGKEFRRINWLPKNRIFKDFVIVLIICLFLALLFLAIDMILISI